MTRQRRSRRRDLRQLLLGVLAVLVAVSGLLVTPVPAKAEDATRVLFLLDVSGSMNERISSGGTKFAAAKRALKRVADAVPAGTQVGLRVYGSEISEPKDQNPKACTDTKLVLPVGPLNRSKLFRAVDSYRAKGETPIAYSLGKAVEDFGPSGKRVLILISDGEESCDGDPCPAARRLAKAGVDLQFNAIGLAVNSKARSQLQCIAKAGDGNYYDADNTTELEDAVRKVHAGARRIPTVVAERLAERMGGSDLTGRELEVLEQIVRGKSNKEIASALGISEATVKSHINNVLSKLDAADRTQAATKALQRGIVHLP